MDIGAAAFDIDGALCPDRPTCPAIASRFIGNSYSVAFRRNPKAIQAIGQIVYIGTNDEFCVRDAAECRTQMSNLGEGTWDSP